MPGKCDSAGSGYREIYGWEVSAGSFFVYVGCEAAMKSDEEFIAGIYRKAEEKRKEEEKTKCGQRVQAWRILAAAACLCLIVSGVVYMGSQRKVPQRDPVSEQDAVMALSVENEGEPAADGEKSPRARTFGSDGAEDVSVVGQPKRNVVLDAFWAGCESAHFLMEPSLQEDNDNTQEAGGN